MALVLYVGAARADARPEQFAELRDGMHPALDTYRDTGDTRPLLDLVARVRGADWEPTGKWKRQIDLLQGRR
jgi:hypothetical protein